MDDKKAIALLKKGDVRALEALVLRYQSQALKTAFLITRDRALSEDVVQAAFIRVYERAEQFDDARSFGPWLNRIVRNDAVKAASRQNRDEPLSRDWLEGEYSFVNLVPDPGPGPHDIAEQSEAQQTIWAALEQLSPAQRAAVVDRYYLGLSEAESAERHGHTQGAVKQLLHRAKARLRSLLTAEQPDRAPAKEVSDE
jgi:RNA polymerase sigma-70 factor (ECF subfamily)